MKRIVSLFLSVLAVIALSGCRDSHPTCPQPIEAFITDLYQHYVFGYGQLDSLAEHFSPAVRNRLRKAYDDEYCDGGPAYAVWLFRTSQNGDFRQSLDSIKAEGRHYYTAYLTEGDIPCTCRMRIVTKSGVPVMTDFTTTYTYPDQDYTRKPLSLEALEGEWRVMAVQLEGVTYATVTMTFDIKEGLVSAYAGCNYLGGQVVQRERSADALRIENLCSTEMYCGEESAQLERKLGQALDRVRRFYGIGEDVYMADEDDVAVLHLSRPSPGVE